MYMRSRNRRGGKKAGVDDVDGESADGFEKAS
jgi:hypothetical protein